MRKSRKLIAILATLALLATLLVPMVTPAAAAGTYTAIGFTTVSDEGDRALGKVKVEFNTNDVTGAEDLFFSLPASFKYFPDAVNRSNVVFGTDTVNGTVYLGSASGDKYIELSVAAGSNAVSINDFTLSTVSDNQFKVSYDGTPNGTQGETDAIFYVDFKKVYVPSYDGDIKVAIDVPNGSAFSDGSVVIGTTSGGKVAVAVTDTETSNSDFEVTLRIEENVTGALENKADSLKFILPDGYEWKSSPFVSTTHIWGDDLGITASDFTVDKDELSFNPGAASSTKATCFEVTLAFEVVDESKVKAGDITAQVRGESTVTPSSLVVGTYGDYSATVEAVDASDLPTVYSGKVEQAISDIKIKESIAGSISNGRYIKFELPSYARWTTVPNTVTDNGLTLTFDGVAGSVGNIVKYKVTGPSNSAAELEMKDMEVLLDVCAPGDLKVKVYGNAGVEGEFAVAKIASSITAKAESKPEVKIGMAAQKIGDITITEAKAGAIKEGTLSLKVPQGVEIAKLPKVEVVSGDLDIDTAGIYRSKPASTDFYQIVNIPIENDSNDASTIKISDLYVTVDRTVAEGDLKVAIFGSAVLESNGDPKDDWFNDSQGDINNDNTIDYYPPSGTYSGTNDSLFPATAAYTAAAAATVVTPAPGEQKAKVVFTINDTKYTVNGVDQTMDVAPYIKDGRTFVPVRYVAQALGVTPENILYADGKVTLIKGDKVVQLTIGSNVMVINGISIAMDVPAEIKDGRTMLPFRWVAQALGAKVNWDEATQTVTMEL
ncbi:MAG: copper amine oxidase N-terminal domain-containing protein [Bacillota bacterium]